MSEKEIAQIEESILKARKEGLLKANDTTMNSHGKLWGMDVFSWINPNPAVLRATMESFPFPVIWIASMPERMEIVLNQDKLKEKIYHTLILEEEMVFSVDENSSNFIHVKSINEAFETVQKVKIKPSILLFSYSKSDWEYQKRSFNDYLSLAQAK